MSTILSASPADRLLGLIALLVFLAMLAAPFIGLYLLVSARS